MASQHAEIVFANADSFAGCRLAGDRQKGIPHNQSRFQSDEAGDVKDNRARSFGFDRGAQTSWSSVIEIGDFDHPATATSASEPAITFSGRKGELPLGDIGVIRILIAASNIGCGGASDGSDTRDYQRAKRAKFISIHVKAYRSVAR